MSISLPVKNRIKNREYTKIDEEGEYDYDSKTNTHRNGSMSNGNYTAYQSNNDINNDTKEAITKVALRWKNITYSIRIKDPKSEKKCNKPKIEKYILKNISGRAMPGELVAIMGPSGSGKTTLLNVLSSRCVKTKGAVLTGSITVNGIERKELGSKFSAISAFVQQDDVLFNMQTVKETLLTASRLRLSKEVSMSEKKKRVNSIISELGLRKAQNTKIGDEKHRGVSGGERKRTNIGVEIINLPSLIFLDEPTSGLDSFQALNVMLVLKQLCKDFGVTVISSIHQPRSSIYSLFDRLILLAEGEVAYDGKGGKVALKYFEKIGFKIEDNFNPADHYLDLISEDSRGYELESRSKKRIESILTQFKKKSDEHEKEIELTTKEYSTTKHQNKLMETINKHNNGVVSSFEEQMIILAQRNLRQLFRDKFALFMRMFTNIFFALFLSMLWSDMGYTQKDVQNRIGILFFIAINQSFGGLIGTLQVFSLEKGIVMRELQSNSYYLSSYYITKFITQLPMDAVFPVVFSCVIYYIVGLNPDPYAFLIFIAITLLTSFSAISIGFFIGSCTPNIDAANAIAPLIMVISILFGGFYINSDSIPDWISWLENLSTIKWAFEAFIINEFTGLDDWSCTEEEEQEGPCIQNGQQVIAQLSFDKYPLITVMTVLVGLFVAFHCIAFICLKCSQVKYIDPDNDKDKGIQHRSILTLYKADNNDQYSIDIKKNDQKTPLIITE